VRTTGGIVGFDPAHFNVITTAAGGTTGFSNPVFGGVFSLEVSGNDLVLRFTPNLPIVTPATSSTITTAGATLSGAVTPQGILTTVYFEYGTSPGFGQVTRARPRAAGVRPFP